MEPLIFIAGGLGHFSHQEIAYAASQGVPIANILVPVSGIIAIVGGLSILFGFLEKSAHGYSCSFSCR